MSEQCKCVQGDNIKRIIDINDEQAKELNQKVSWTIFWSIVVLLVTISGMVSSNFDARLKEQDSNLEKQIQNLESKTTASDLVQVRIETQLAEIQKQLADINTKLAKIR